MKTNEFIEEAGSLGYDVDNCSHQLVVLGDDGIKVIAIVQKNTLYSVDTNHVYFDKLDIYDREMLFTLLMDYAKTPVVERDNYKYRYRLNDDILVKITMVDVDEPFYELYPSDEEDSGIMKTSFTDTEFKEFPKWAKVLSVRGHFTKEEVE